VIFEKYSIDLIAKLLLKVVNRITYDMAGVKSILSDAPDDYNPGQRYYTEITRPCRCTFYTELSPQAKKKIVENVFSEKWENLKSVQIDDCLLEFTWIIAARTVAELSGRSEPVKTGFPMVIFDEYEDNLEITEPEDLYRVDFSMDGALFSVLVSSGCNVT